MIARADDGWAGAGLSVIIPTRALEFGLRARCARLRQLLPAAELLVVEPLAPGAGPPPPPRRDGDLWRVFGPRGRGTQCNAGARAASGDLLLFLHDDTDLPATAPALIAAAFARPGVQLACFRLRFDDPHWLLRLYGWGSWFDSYWTTFGDQAFVLRRTWFDTLGGFPDWPLFEDVELARRSRRRTRIVKLPAAVTTSAVRYRQHGVVRQQVRNAALLIRFLLGASPEALRARYEAEPTRLVR